MSMRRKTSVYLLLAVLSTAWLAQSTRADPVNWRNNLEAAQVEAARTGKLVLLHFYTASCGPCKKLERDVFSQPQIAAAMERDFIPVKLNADQSPALANAYRISRVPSEVVLTSQGNIVQKLSCPLEPADYGAQLANVAQQYRQRYVTRTASVQTPIHSAYAGLKIGQPNNTQTATAIPTTSKAPLVPAVMKNPYVTAAPPAAPVVQQPVAPEIPANAMPNSYRDRYAAVTAPAPAAKQPPITPTQTAPPITPSVAAVTPAIAAPPIAKTNIATPPAATLATPPATQQAATAAPVAPPIAVEAWPPQLPAGTPPLAFDGYCPVSLQAAQKWVRGNKTFGAIHRGRTYLFAGDSQRQKFLAAPDAYSPVFSGNDPVKMLDENKQIAGNRKFGFAYRNAFYLFSSKETMARFASQPDRYSAGVRQAMNRMDTAGETVRR